MKNQNVDIDEFSRNLKKLSRMPESKRRKLKENLQKYTREKSKSDDVKQFTDNVGAATTQLSLSKELYCFKELPQGYSCENGKLYHEQKGKDNVLIANSIPVVNKKTTIIYIDGTKRTYITMQFIVEGEKVQEELQLWTDNLKDFEFDRLHYLTINPLCRNAKRHLVNIIKHSMANVESDNKLFYDRLGWIEGEYVAGNKVIYKDGVKGSGDILIDAEVKKLENGVYQAISLALQKVLRILAKHPQATVVLFYTLATMLRSLFMKAGVSHWFTLNIVGDTEMGKTTTSKFWSNIFRHNISKYRQVLGLGDSKPYIYECLGFYRDSVVVLDDMNKSASKETKRKKEHIFTEIIQDVANNYGHSTMRKTDALEGGVVVTAEYILENESTLNRTLLMLLEVPIFDKASFEKLKTDQTMIPTICFHFLQWAARKKDEIVEAIEQEFRRTYRFSSHDRINDSAAIMIITGVLFDKFCTDQTGDAVLSQTIFIRFEDCLKKMCWKQDSVIARISRENTEVDFGVVLFHLLKYEDLDIGGKSLDKHTFVKKDGCLIVKLEILNSVMHSHLKGFKFTKNMISRQLDENGLLHTDNSRQHKRTKKHKDYGRALHIDLIRLREHYFENKDSLLKELKSITTRSPCGPLAKSLASNGYVNKQVRY